MITQSDDKPLVLVVEDDPNVARVIMFYLEDDFHLVAASSYHEALQKLQQLTPALIVLDLELQGDREAGFRLCQHIRSQQSGPLAHLAEVMILMLTKLDKETDGLNIGADNYLSKSSLKRNVLVARINALLRRLPPEQRGSLIKVSPLIVNKHRRTASIHGQELSLTGNEYYVLSRLAQKPGVTVSRIDILGVDSSSRTVDQTIFMLRKKLNQAYDGAGKMIVTVSGANVAGDNAEGELKGGYRLVPLQ
jgi:DNA-binding response OmpR family regulator